MSALVQALEEYADELEEAEEGSGLTYVTALRDAALAKITGGESKSLVSSTVNGQTFAVNVNVAADEMFSVCQEVLRGLKGKSVKFTIPAFHGIPH